MILPDRLTTRRGSGGTISVMPDELSCIPGRLRDNVERWRQDDHQPQRGMRWNRLTWQVTLPEHRDFLAQLPDLVDRETVAGHGARAADDGQTAVQPKNNGAGERLRGVAEQVRTGGGVATPTRPASTS